MKPAFSSITIRRGGRVLIALAGLFALYLVSKSCGWIPASPGDLPVVIRSSIRDDEQRKKYYTVAIYPSALFAAGLLENGGLGPGKSDFSLRHGIKIRFTMLEDPAQCMEALASRDVDIAWMTADTLALLYRRHSGSSPVAFFHYGWSRGEHAVAADATIGKIADFKGKTIACAENSPCHFFALYLLSTAGVKPSQVRWRFTLTNEDAAYLFARKRAHVCVGTYPSLHRAASRRKAGLLLSSADASFLIPGVFVTREAFLVRNREGLAAFIAGWLEGREAARQNPQQAMRILSSAAGFSPEEASGSLRLVRQAGLADNRSFFGLTGDGVPGFSFTIATARSVWLEEKEALTAPSSLLQNTDALIRAVELLQHRKALPDTVEAPGGCTSPAGAVRHLAGPFPLDFPANGTALAYGSRSQLERTGRIAAVFGSSCIFVRGHQDPSEERWTNLPQRRALEVCRLLNSMYGIPRGRCFISEGPDSRFPEKDRGGRSVEVVLAGPRLN